MPGALARADFLRVPRFIQALAPDEWPIPSVRGVGGSLIYFVDAATRAAMWAHEFPHPIEAPVAGPRLARRSHRADHAVRGIPELAAVLRRAVRRLEDAPARNRRPHGLIQSQAVESADRSVRFTLNGSLAAQSLTSRFIQNYFGAGVQHIAFATDDIFAVADAAHAQGLPRLEIPRNYFDDLEARWGLDPDLIEPWPRATSSTIATARPNISSSTAAPLPAACFSKWSSGGAMPDMARSTRRSAWPRRPATSPNFPTDPADPGITRRE
jgi:4-hydroxyphenylpyruvate dioxygenase